MRMTFLGHAGLFIETKHGSILLTRGSIPPTSPPGSPSPATKISPPRWRQSRLCLRLAPAPRPLRPGVAARARLQRRHRPLAGLPARRCSKTRCVTRLHQIHPHQERRVDATDGGLKMAILAQIAPTDGPLGDSGLIVDDGETRIFDQNDSRPVDIGSARQPRPVRRPLPAILRRDLVSDGLPLPGEDDARAGPQEARERDGARPALYQERSARPSSIPSAGPPCFLDDELFGFNDFDRDPTNTFPDQTVFLDYMPSQGLRRRPPDDPRHGRRLSGDRRATGRPSHTQIDEREAHLHRKARLPGSLQGAPAARIDASKASWPRGQVDVLTSLK